MFFYSFVHIAMLVADFHVRVPVYLNCIIFATTWNFCSSLVVLVTIVFFFLGN